MAYSFTVGCKTAVCTVSSSSTSQTSDHSIQTGFTVILVERGPGVETKPIKTSYSPTAGTGTITFDDVKVPVGNTLGAEGSGIFVILRFAFVST